jgi:hypothetical protein
MSIQGRPLKSANGPQAPSLEQKISSALTDDNIASGDLESLISEVETAIVAGDQVAEAEHRKALDPALSPDISKARQSMEDAKFAAARLRTLLPRLQKRFGKVQAREHLAQWQAGYEALKIKRDELATELCQIYPPAAAKITDLFHRIAANDAALSVLHQQRPAGVGLHLHSAELVARGLDGFTRDEPSIANGLKLPDWEHGAQMTWPPPPQRIDPTLLMPVRHGDPRLYTDRWYEVCEEQRAAEEARQKREAIEADRARREFYRRRN